MTYDLAIIGGGIQGAACAQAATARGYSVLVLEQYDKPGLATSQKSSKLIHGGLRYLESFQFRLVRECLRERQILLKNAPHLVKLTPFYIPVYSHTRRPPWLIRLGLTLYYLFGGKRFKSIPKQQWHQLDHLNTKYLRAVFQYYDAQTDDQKLTESVMLSAQSLGADIFYQAHFIQANCDNDICRISYKHDHHTHEVKARLLINASGPWVNGVLDKVYPSTSQLQTELVLGSHIIVEGQQQGGVYYLETPQDQRAVFVMPWQGNTLIGTTERHYKGDLHNIVPPKEDIDYLLAVYNYYFTPLLRHCHVIDAFAGVRVLPSSQHRAFFR
ncbi:MAG: glycerol-3-phosphate dehydrogenase/oxidase, partial [Gammaproteobacteria bacterium]